MDCKGFWALCPRREGCTFPSCDAHDYVNDGPPVSSNAQPPAADKLRWLIAELERYSDNGRFYGKNELGACTEILRAFEAQFPGGRR